ncbi:MAG: response regulator transcription factor [Caldilineaceae bacterium]|nr:response regulator transcription factor [Caldilineaceae bacterium]
MARIFIVEDHPVVRRGYVSFLSREPGIVICGEAESAQTALAKLPAAKPDVVVLDVSLPGEMNGIDLLRELRRLYPKLPILVVSGNEEAVYGGLVMKLGAWGYVMKGNVDVFMHAVRGIVDYARRQAEEVEV